MCSGNDIGHVINPSLPYYTTLRYFTGHGEQVKDVSGDEEDGEDEAIMPADYKEGDESSLLIDDDIYQEVAVHT